jgi:steroid 5-alpha reductase family enzyme
MLARMRQHIPDSKAAGAVISAAAYVVALAVAVLVVRAVGLSGSLAQTALGTLVATVVIFAFSVAVDNSSMYDPYWSLQPLALAGYYVWTGWGSLSGRQVLILLLALLYAVRLTSNFYRDWPGLTKEDFRYVGFRRSAGRLYWPVSFLAIHLFPTIMVFLGCLPMYAAARPGTAGLGWLDAVGTLVVLGAVVLAFAADEQMRRFREDPANRGCSIRSGLWAQSRHPNYLGEILTWWGFWLLALAAGLQWWWTVAGALAITVMFVLASVPMMEKRALETRSGYPEYREQAPMLVPRLWRREHPGTAEAGD